MKQRKFIALILALALLLIAALPMTASAATGPMFSDGTITIQPPASGILVLTASDFKAYKLFNVTAITGNNTDGYQFAYEPVEGVKTFLMGLPSATAYGLVPADFPINAGNVDAKAEKFRKWLQDEYEETLDEPAIIALAKVMVNAGVLGTAITATQDGKNVKFGDGTTTRPLDAGYYLVTGEGKAYNDPETSDGAHTGKVISRGMLVNVPELTWEEGYAYVKGHATGTNKHPVRKLKADAPRIDKMVWYHDKANTGNPYNGTGAPANATDPGWQKWSDVSIGDTVYFKHVSAVPDMTGYDKYQFIVHDYMSPGLTFNESSVKVTVGGTELVNTANKFYTVATDDVPASTAAHPTVAYANGTYITITFKPEEFVKFARNAAVIITYTAELNAKAIIGAGALTPPGNPNKVWLEYSNNPNWSGEGKGPTGETPEDEVIVYTFDIEIYKYAGTLNVDDYPLDGAEFELSKKTGVSGSNNTYGAAIELVSLDPATNNGYHYRTATPADTVKTTTIVISTANGRIKIKGLDAGEYALTETKPPVGYNLPGFITEIKITHDGRGGYDVYVGEAKTNTINIQNNTGSQLPGTGGIGLYVFLGVGGVMAILLATAYIIYRKKKILGELKV